jgi:phage-related protein/predicted XRE-type DNA-binding protein
MTAPMLKELVWVASSLKDLRAFPEEVRQVMGFALYQAQTGGRHIAAKPLRGFGGAGVLEVVGDHDGDTYRAVYTVRFAEAVYVLHAFQKKAAHGIATPKRDIDVVRTRLESARRLHERHTDPKGTLTMDRTEPEHSTSSGNVFADLQLPASDELVAKAALAAQITSIATHRHLTQQETAGLLGTTQPKVSELFAGKLAGFSMERLIRFLNALDRDVCIVVSPKPRRRERGTLRVAKESATSLHTGTCR